MNILIILMLTLIVIAAIIVYTIIKLVGYSNCNGYYHNIRCNRALDILNERFVMRRNKMYCFILERIGGIDD